MSKVYPVLLIAMLGLIVADEIYDAEAIEYHHLHYPQSPADTGETWCVVGDGGLANDAFSAVVESMVAAGCDQLRYVGDLVYPAGIESIDDPMLRTNFLQPLSPLTNLGVPVYLILGNHDWRGNPHAWLQVASVEPMIHKPYFHYAETYSDICVFNIETLWFEKLYFIERRLPKTGWIKKA